MVIGLVVSLRTVAVSNSALIAVAMLTHIDDRDDIACSLAKFAQVDCEVVQLVSLCFVVNISRSFPNGIDAAKICRWVEFWIRWGGQSDVG